MVAQNYPSEPATSVPTEAGGLARLRLDLAYDGTEFAGWARQPGLRTVQGEVEAALARVLRLPEVRVTCAGRTDAGVHARGQVAHVDVPAEATGIGTSRIAHRLRAVLPDDVGLWRVELAPAGFDARFSALSRTYRYTISDGGQLIDPLRRREVLVVRSALDVDAMNRAAEALLGEHDFAAFCRKRPGASTIRSILHLAWQRERAGLVRMHITADAFCHSMVRGLVGAFLLVGQSKRSPAWLGEYLATAARGSGVQVVPPRGLVLEAVAYPPDADLFARSITTRAYRGSSH